MNNINSDLCESLFKKAFTEEMLAEANTLPSDGELKGKYSIPKKHVKQGLRRLKEKLYNRPLSVVYFQRALIIILIILAVFVAILTLNDTLRNTFFNWTKEQFGIISVDNKDEPSDPIDIHSLEIGYIPDGFELLKDRIFKEFIYFEYTNENSDNLTITVSSNPGKQSEEDELSDAEYFKTDLFEARVIYRKEEKRGYVVMGNDNVKISIAGSPEKSELIKIAKNIKLP